MPVAIRAGYNSFTGNPHVSDPIIAVADLHTSFAADCTWYAATSSPKRKPDASISQYRPGCTIKNQISKIILTEWQAASLDVEIGQKPGGCKSDQVSNAIPVD